MKKHLSLFGKSIHPIKSRVLGERLLTKTISFYISYVIIGLFLMLGIFVVLNWNKPFDIGEISTNESIILVERPLVSLDDQLNETTSFIAFSNEEISYKKFIFFGRTQKTYTNELTLLLLPGIVLLIGVISLFLGIILALLSCILAYTFVKKNDVSFRDLMVINLHYQAPALLFFFILFPFWNSAFFIFLLYLFNFVVGVVLLSTKKFKTIDL